MPFIKIQLVQGRTQEQKEKVAKHFREIASKELNAPIENVKVIFEDMKKEDYFG